MGYKSEKFTIQVTYENANQPGTLFVCNSQLRIKNIYRYASVSSNAIINFNFPDIFITETSV